MLKTYVTIYRNLRNGQTYRISKKYGVECKCMLTGEWYPSPMTLEQLDVEAASYTVSIETTLGRWVRRATTVTLSPLRLLGALRHV